MPTIKSFSTHVAVVAIAVVMLTQPFGWSQEPNAKLTVPDEAAQKETAKLIEEVYGDELGEAKKSTEKVALARKLLGAGRETNDDVAGKYGLFRLALKMSSSVGDVDTALEAIVELEKAFQVDALAMKVEALESIAKLAMPADQRKQLALAAAEIIDEAIAADNYDAAEKLASVAVVAARKSRDLGLARQAVKRVAEIKALHAEFQEVSKAINVLEDDPTNAAANLTVGKYQCFVKGDWGDGLPMLALGNDPALKELAEKEFIEPDAPRAQMKLGDRWWDLANQQDQPAKRRMRERAAHWYIAAFPGLTGLAKAKVKKRLAEVPPTTFPSPTGTSTKVKAPVVRSDIPTGTIRFGGSRYKFFEEKLTWPEAKRKCESLGGHLVCIETAAEHRFIAMQFGNNRITGVWAGGTDERIEGTWVWVNGAPFDYSKWYQDKPNNQGGEEHYLILGLSGDFTWNDGRAFWTYPFICEWAITTRGRARPSTPAFNRKSSAQVNVPGLRFEPLIEGMVIYDGLKLINIPKSLASGFLINKGGNVRGNTTDFKILRDGKVYLLMSGRPGGGGNLSGNWKPKIILPSQLAADGWSDVTKIDLDKHPACVVYERNCRKGESFTYSWEKYIPPAVIVQAN